MGHAALFKQGSVIPRLAATDKQGLIEELLDLLVEKSSLPSSGRPGVLKALLAREELGSTGVGGGVAIPHVKMDGVSETVAALGICADGIDYAAVDGEPVHVVFMVVSPASEAEQHLSVLQWISKMARHQDFVRFMRGSNSSEDIVDILEEIGG